MEDSIYLMILNQEGIVAFNEYHVAAAKLPNLLCFSKLYSYKFIISVILNVLTNGYLCICNYKCTLFSILTRNFPINDLRQ